MDLDVSSFQTYLLRILNNVFSFEPSSWSFSLMYGSGKEAVGGTSPLAEPMEAPVAVDGVGEAALSPLFSPRVGDGVIISSVNSYG